MKEEELIKKKLSIYETIAILFSFIPFPIPKKLRERLKDEITFTHLQITPEQAFRVSITLPLLISSITLIFYIFNLITFDVLSVFIFASIILFYFLFNYTKYYSYYFRSKASSEMVLSILYMSIALRTRPNLENAIYYAAENLDGPLGLDFKKGVYELYLKKKLNASEVIKEIAEKWKVESKEFVEALEVITSGVLKEDVEKSLSKALDLVINGTIKRMETYAYQLKTPLRIITMFGITLPLMLLVTLPIFLLFMPQIITPQAIAISYDLILPLIVYILLFQHLFRRPFSFHQVKVSEIEEIRKYKRKVLGFSSLIGLFVLAILIFFFTRNLLLFDEFQLYLSLLLVILISSPILLYYFLISRKIEGTSEEIIKVEDELPEAIYLLSSELGYGKPLEKAIEDIIPKIKEAKISKFFKNVTNNFKVGMTIDKAIFDENFGAIKNYPSSLLKMISRVMVDISKTGSQFLSSALEDLSKYLNNVKELDLKTKEILSETVSEIRINSLVVAPLTAGIVVGLTIIVLSIFFYFRGSIAGMESFFKQYGEMGEIASFGFLSMLNVSKLIPSSVFQLIVGIYLIELGLLLNYFYNEIMFGEDEHSRSKNSCISLLEMVLFYILIVFAIYFVINVLTNMKELAKIVI